MQTLLREPAAAASTRSRTSTPQPGGSGSALATSSKAAITSEPDPFVPPPNTGLPSVSAHNYGIIQSDPNAFRAFYKANLTCLVENSRPVIGHLTWLAAENVGRMAGVIVGCIEERLKEVSYPLKLSTLYLLDSICKNLSAPYTTLFARSIERLFLTVYRQVDGPIKVKMEELLGTWRTGGSGGSELFGDAVQRGIEVGLFGRGGRGGGIGAGGRGLESSLPYMNGVKQLQNAITNEKYIVLQDVDSLLRNRRARLAIQSDDEALAGQVEALIQLQSLIQSTELTSEQLAQIRLQVQALFEQPLPGVRASVTPPPMAQIHPIHPVSIASSTFPPIEMSNDSLYSSLIAAGLLQNDDEETAFRDQLKQSILGVRVQITTTGIKTRNELAVHLLFSALPLQCKQCMLPFTPTAAGRSRLNGHIDWHFRANKRLRESSNFKARATSRAYYPCTVEEWIESEVRPDVIEQTDQPGSKQLESATNVEADAPQADLSGYKVPVPEDPAQSREPCPICKEQFSNDWDEDEEEWIWRNAVENDGVIYHATCLRDAQIAAKSRRLRDETSSVGGVVKDEAEDSVMKTEVPDTEPDVEPSVKVTAPAISTSTEKPSPTPEAELAVDIKMEEDILHDKRPLDSAEEIDDSDAKRAKVH